MVWQREPPRYVLLVPPSAIVNWQSSYMWRDPIKWCWQQQDSK